MKIYARSKNHALLRNGAVPLIGFTTESKRYKTDGTCELQIRVVFDLENNGHEDIFLFENNKLVFNAISLFTEAFATDAYRELIGSETVTPEAFIAVVKEFYVFKKMGFLD